MAAIEFEQGAIRVDAAIVGENLGVAPALVPACMRDGTITSLCERGVDRDAGRYRLTFFRGNRRFRLIIDEGGTVVRRSTIDFGDRPLPAALRRPGS